MARYSVDLSRGITEAFFIDLENIAGLNVRLRKRLTEVTIELFQNILKHAINLDESSLVIQNENSICYIVAVNAVAAKDVPYLTKNIDCINALDRVQLKKQHTKILGEPTQRKKSGAGLGFYRMALRSASKLVHDFRQLNQHNFTFSLHITLT